MFGRVADHAATLPFVPVAVGVAVSQAHEVDLFAQLVWLGLAIIGGIAHELHGYIKGERQSVHLGRLAAQAVVSGFAGYLLAHGVYQIEPRWALVAAGLGGYSGTRSIELLTAVVQKKLKSWLK